MPQHAVVVGAGAGGLASAVELAVAGWHVTVVERGSEPGGKMHHRTVDGVGIDGGPTVFTMYWVFERLFQRAGANFSDRVALQRSNGIARHAWTDGSQLDLYSDIDRSSEAIAAFSDERNAEGFRDFSARGELVHSLLKDNFMATSKPSVLQLGYRLLRDGGLQSLTVAPHQTLWQALGKFFPDERLRQLYGRYATYVGSSPLLTPSTLMLIAHVEREGVWCVNGGMRALARAIADLGEERGVDFRFDSHVQRILVESGRAAGVELASGERLKADAVVFNGDAAAVGAGLLGQDATSATPSRPRAKRALSAITWCVRAKTSGFELDHHNVFFANNYTREFDQIFKHRAVTEEPTVYICAQDRVNGRLEASDRERLLLLVNAPADGDSVDWQPDDLLQIRQRTLDVAAKGGCHIDFEEDDCVTTSPTDWNNRFPESGGALYGSASHGMMSSFTRPGAESKVKGLFFAGGSVHPGPGVPMATLSGSIAAQAVLKH